MIKLCGLWLKDGKKGKFFSGKLGSASIFIFKNQYKKEDKHPDYEIWIDQPKKQEKKAPSNDDDFGF